MIWAVFDTTTWVLASGWGGRPGEVVDRFLRGDFLAVTSPAVLSDQFQAALDAITAADSLLGGETGDDHDD
jgi:hypothetical protein